MCISNSFHPQLPVPGTCPALSIFRLTRDIVHWCDFHKVTPHYVQAFAATNNLQSLGKKWICDQETHLT